MKEVLQIHAENTGDQYEDTKETTADTSETLKNETISLDQTSTELAIAAPTAEEKRAKLLAKISKSKKKGKLNKKDEDDKEEKSAELDVYYKMFASMGGFSLMVPFLVSISIFSYLELYREKQIKSWANKVAKDQQSEFYFSVVSIFGVTLICAALIIVKIKLKMDMKTKASLKFFTEMLDRVMGAPINLYFDVTPIGRIQTRFTKDLNAVEGQFYNILQDFLTIGFKLANAFILVISNFPQVICIFIFMGYYMYDLRKSTLPVRKQYMRLSRGTHTPITNLSKITFTGNSVLRAFNYEQIFMNQHIALCH